MAIKGLKKSKNHLKLKKKKKSPISSGLEGEQQQQMEELMYAGAEIAEDDDSMMTMKKKKKKRKLMDESVFKNKGKTPFQVVYGRSPTHVVDLTPVSSLTTPTPDAFDAVEYMCDIHQQKSKKGEGIKKKNDIKNDGVLQEEVDGKNSKVKKSGKMAKKDISQRLRETADTKSNEANEVYEIPAVDDDFSKGMKKWVTEYDQCRPGLEIRQQEIDDFIVAYEARKEKERKEREALAAEGGWTVVTHHKGRKKTMDAESGIAVGSVAEAAVLEKIAKKKNKDPAKDFYRFQRREAQRNEVMMLQSKFEQDKKRIQQLRAARKFRPF